MSEASNPEIIIPESHWNDGFHNWRNYVPHWEKTLRASIAARPDPAERFTDWLSRTAQGEVGMPGLKLIFLEQPYLAWAQDVERAIENSRRELRQEIAREIADPSED